MADGVRCGRLKWFGHWIIKVQMVGCRPGGDGGEMCGQGQESLGRL